jgi:dolichol-phosphate mannosyltransferase
MTNRSKSALISIVAPLYNESGGVEQFHADLTKVLQQSVKLPYEIIYADDGSIDGTLEKVLKLARRDTHVRVAALSRNFGKEIAMTAGIHQARGDAIITIDSDGQHPVELIPDFIARWEAGNKVVAGIRTGNQKEGFVKRQGSRLFYGLFSRMTGLKLTPGLSDFRLIDASVRLEFLRMTERNRITRGIIDWLGYPASYVTFKANSRMAGQAGYSFKKLLKLAIDSVISLSISPLYLAAYLGAVVLPLSLLLGLGMVVNQLIGDPFNLNITGGAYVIVLMLFLIGILLISQGIIGLYLSHIHAETQNRPLYIINKANSKGIDES